MGKANSKIKISFIPIHLIIRQKFKGGEVVLV
jgi:hypothetical protein